MLFIDEIHRLPKAVEEFMYPAMEDFRIDITLGEGVNARTVNMALKPFTMIGATTRTGLLSAPLRDRFQIREHLEFYSRDELTEIIRRNAAQAPGRDRRRRRPKRSPSAVAARRGSPTIGCAGSATTPPPRPTARSRSTSPKRPWRMLGIDPLGLDPQDRKYLETILRVFHGGPVGVEAIAHTLNTATDTLTDEVEPFLLRSRTGRPHPARPQAHRQGLRTPRRGTSSGDPRGVLPALD